MERSWPPCFIINLYKLCQTLLSGVIMCESSLQSTPQASQEEAKPKMFVCLGLYEG